MSHIDPDRAERAYTDVLAVEWDREAGLMRIVTLSDCYTAIPTEGLHQCPDREYNLDGAGYCKHAVAADVTRGRLPTPPGWVVTDNLDDRTATTALMADGGEAVEAEPAEPTTTTTDDADTADASAEHDDSGGQWGVRDIENDNTRWFPARGEAENAIEDLKGLVGDPEQIELVPPDADDAPTDTPPTTSTAEVVEPTSDAADTAPDPATAREAAKLPERTVGEDPLNWVPGDFIDVIDGTPAINRKGFEVLAWYYDVEVHADIQVAPEDTSFEFCRVKATATTPSGRECQAFGSAHVDRGDDPWLLLEMADTRARKRALSIATGVGAVAVEELKNEVDADE